MSKRTSVDEVLKAIRSHCLDCSGRSSKAVDDCVIKECALYPYRNKRELQSEIGGSIGSGTECNAKSQIEVVWNLDGGSSK